MKKMQALLIIALMFLFGMQQSVVAQVRLENTTAKEEHNLVLFTGIEEDMMVFDLLFNQIPLKGCQLIIADETGNELFSEWISGNSCIRRYKIVRNGYSKIEFRASGKGLVFQQAFTIRTEEKLLVTKTSGNP